MSLYTFIHIGISLAGILSGVIVLAGLINSKRLEGWTAIFLFTTVLTSVTGFFFPFHHLTPALALSFVSLIILVIAIYARYLRRLAGGWRKAYVISAMTALYCNVFVLIVQLFQKVAALKEMAPTQKEPPFAITQLICLGFFIAMTALAAIKFRDRPLPTV
ncbi:MAG TPA: hypothetical protein VG938_00640 [Verrucomicrobiae bacterium]|jgi:hypothetical protein|nr:hypothetical protein [Verrucomicrobiae bacterium]